MDVGRPDFGGSLLDGDYRILPVLDFYGKKFIEVFDIACGSGSSKWCIDLRLLAWAVVGAVRSSIVRAN